MTKRFRFLAIALCATLGISASPLKPEEALARLMLTSAHKLPAKGISDPKLEYTSHTPSGDAAVYVFNINDSKGYMLLSADDCAAPLLGYSDKGSFKADSMPPALKYWLDAYTMQITYMKAGTTAENTYTGVTLPEEWTPVSPLLSSKWDQSEPYNDSCPTYRKRKCVTGCVATAMAQAMNYFKYPDVGRDSIKYRPNTLNRTLKFNFYDHPFDWDNMLDTYIEGEYNDRQSAAVANLMVACGMSVKMLYGTDVSGAYSQNIADALIRYFNYDEGTRYLTRNDYSYSEWAKMIYDNLKNVGPVIYSGQSPLQGGHSFVCDGYDGNGYFHFNWGWSGISDGYFLLDTLSPDVIGIGGYTGGFSVAQDIILGMQPPTGNTPAESPKRATQYGMLTSTVNDNILFIGIDSETQGGWGYNGADTAFFDFGAIVENIDNPSEPKQYIPSLNFIGIEIPSGRYIPYKEEDTNYSPQFNLDDLNFSSGDKYKFTFSSKDTESDEDWIPVKTGYGTPNYTIVEKTDTGYVAQNVPFATFTLNNIKVPEIGYYNKPITFEVEISNNTGIELSRSICAAMGSENENIFVSESFLLTLAPGETILYRLTSPMVQFSGTKPTDGEVYQIEFGDLGTGFSYETEPTFITMKYEDTGVTSVIGNNPGINLNFNDQARTLSISSDVAISDISVTSIDGLQTRYPVQSGNTETTIDLSTLCKGAYIITATAADGTSKSIKLSL